MTDQKLTAEELKTLLSDLPIGEIRCEDRVGSTNDLAFEWAAEGAPDLSIVTAFEQTKGRGRMERQWITAPGASLPMTVIIRPRETEMNCLNLFSPLTGLAVSEALREGYGIQCRIKWPNDVLLNGKKICGILCETQWEGDQLQALILGFGTNLRCGAAPKLPDINYPASSIEDETGIIIPRAGWIRSFLIQMIRLRPLIGKPEFFAMWEDALAYRGEPARVIRPDGSAELCTVLGIDPEGSLVVKNEAGAEQHFLAGEISLRPAA